MLTYQQLLGKRVKVITFTGNGETVVKVKHGLRAKPAAAIGVKVEAALGSSDFAWDPDASDGTNIAVYGVSGKTYQLFIWGGYRT